MAALRVGIDLSPLVQSRAGTARYVSELTAALECEPEVELRRYAFGRAGRVSAAARDAVWYPAVLPARARRDRSGIERASWLAPYRFRPLSYLPAGIAAQAGCDAAA